MIKGVVTCSCGQVFGFETAAETVKCPSCKKAHVASEHEVVEEVAEDATLL